MFMGLTCFVTLRIFTFLNNQYWYFYWFSSLPTGLQILPIKWLQSPTIWSLHWKKQIIVFSNSHPHQLLACFAPVFDCPTESKSSFSYASGIFCLPRCQVPNSLSVANCRSSLHFLFPWILAASGPVGCCLHPFLLHFQGLGPFSGDDNPDIESTSLPLPCLRPR